MKLQALLSVAVVAAMTGPVAAEFPMTTYEDYWPEPWLEEFNDADNGFRFSSGSISGETMYLVEDAKVRRSLSDWLDFRYVQHFESGLIERARPESDAWRGNYGVLELDGKWNNGWYAGPIFNPTYDKRVSSLGATFGFRRASREFWRVSAAFAFDARNVQFYYNNEEYSRRYDIPGTWLYAQTVWPLAPRWELWAEGQYFRQLYRYWGEVANGVLNETNLLARAKLRYDLGGQNAARLRYEQEDRRGYVEASYDGYAGRFHLRDSAGYGYYRLRQSDFFSDTYLQWNFFLDTLVKLEGGPEIGLGFGHEEPTSNWMDRFRSPLPIERTQYWAGPPAYWSHIRFLADWRVRGDFKINIFFTFETQVFDFQNFLFWGRLLRVQAEFHF